MTEHLRGEPHEPHDDRKGLPLSPALIQVIDEAAAALAGANSEREADIVSHILRAMVEIADADDGIIGLVAIRVAERASTLAEYGVLYEAGCRAATLGSATTLLTVQDGLHKLINGPNESARYANEAAGRLVMYCAALLRL